jgi:hypothetical protein
VAALDQLLFALGVGALLPLPGVGLPVHDHPLGLRHDSVVAGPDFCGGHLGDGDGDGLALGGHDDDLSADVDAVVVAQDAGNHEFGAVADGVDGGVLDHDPGQLQQQHLEGQHYSAQVGLVLVVFVSPLRVQQVVHRHQVVVLRHAPAPRPAQLLHVPAHSQQQADVNAQGSNVSSRLAGNPEHSQSLLSIELQQLRLVDSPDAEFPLHCGDLWRLLEETASKGIQHILEFYLRVNGTVQSDDANILFTGALLRFGQPGGSG